MRTRIDVYTDDKTKRLIRLAAAQFDMAVTDFCRNAILEKLEEIKLLEAEKIEIPVSKTVKQQDVNQLIAELHALQEKSMNDNEGKLFDVDADLEAMREERNGEIDGLY